MIRRVNKYLNTKKVTWIENKKKNPFILRLSQIYWICGKNLKFWFAVVEFPTLLKIKDICSYWIKNELKLKLKLN